MPWSRRQRRSSRHLRDQRHRRRQVEVVVDRGPEPDSGNRPRGPSAPPVQATRHLLSQLTQRPVGARQPVGAEVQRVRGTWPAAPGSGTRAGRSPCSTSSVTRKKLPADLAIRVPLRKQVLAVHPAADHAVAGDALGLGDLVLVVGEDVVDAAGVDVELLAEVGASTSPSTRCASRGSPRPTGCPRPATRCSPAAFQSAKSRGIALVAGRISPAVPGPSSFSSVLPRQLAVAGKDCDVEVDVAARLVGVAPLDQPGDQLDHLRRRGRSPADRRAAGRMLRRAASARKARS